MAQRYNRYTSTVTSNIAMPVTFIKNTVKRAKVGRLNLRIAPKVRYGLELLSAKERKSLSALFEEFATQLMNERLTERRKRPGEQREVQISILDETWDPLAPDRLVKLALLAPDYLSDRDKTIWTVIQENPDFWRDKSNQTPNMVLIRDSWDSIEKQAEEYLGKHGSPASPA
jgi:hypothetical protein